MTALELFIASMLPGQRVLIIGAVEAEVRAMEAAGLRVDTCSYASHKDRWDASEYWVGPYDGIYCAHTLEHMRNVGLALDRMMNSLESKGLLCIVVPPGKHNIVGGHLTLWNAGLLLYNLVRAHFDCSKAAVRTYDYNVAVLVRMEIALYFNDDLNEDNGDLEKLAPFFPVPLPQNADGRILEHDWSPR